MWNGRPRRRHAARRPVGGVSAVLAVGAVGALLGGWAWIGTISPVATVVTGSMTPTFHVGDLVVMGSLRGAPKVGEVVRAPVPVDVQRRLGYPPA